MSGKLTKKNKGFGVKEEQSGGLLSNDLRFLRPLFFACGNRKYYYYKLLSKAWEKRNEYKILFLYDLKGIGSGIACYDDFNPDLERCFPNMASLWKQSHPCVKNHLILLIAVPPNVVKSLAIPIN